MTDMPDNERLNQHEGHRQRVKRRFLQDGFESFAPHSVLEMVLFYTSPRQDTNGIAHSLIDRFGSLAEVCDAPYEVLRAVPGVGEETALFLKMIPEFARMYTRSRQTEKAMITEPADAVRFFAPHFIGRTNEVFMAAFLNGRGEVIAEGVIAEGDDTAVGMSCAAVVRRAVALNAVAVVAAHNHPNGFAVPSPQDIAAMDRLAASLRLVNVGLCDHIIFSREDSVRMAACKNSAKPYYLFYKTKDEAGIYPPEEQ